MIHFQVVDLLHYQPKSFNNLFGFSFESAENRRHSFAGFNALPFLRYHPTYSVHKAHHAARPIHYRLYVFVVSAQNAVDHVLGYHDVYGSLDHSSLSLGVHAPGVFLGLPSVGRTARLRTSRVGPSAVLSLVRTFRRVLGPQPFPRPFPRPVSLVAAPFKVVSVRTASVIALALSYCNTFMV